MEYVDLKDSVPILQEGFIVAGPSGYVYRNQTGAESCNQKEIEGIFFPFDSSLNRSFFQSFYRLHKHNADNLDAPINDSECVKLNKILTSLLPDFLRGQIIIEVDKNRLKQSEEAWLWILIQGLNPLDPNTKEHAVVVWQNSD